MGRRVGKFHPQARCLKTEGGYRDIGLPAGVKNSFDPTSPRLDHSGPEEGIGDLGVERAGGMLLEQMVDVPSLRELSRVPDHESVVVDADLDWNAGSIILVEDRIRHGLPEGVSRHGEGLDALKILVGDESLEIFGAEQIDRSVDLSEKISVDLVLVQKVGICPEIADLHIAPGHKFLWVWVKEKKSGPLEVGAIGQAKLFDQDGIGSLQVFFREPLALHGTMPEVI